MVNEMRDPSRIRDSMSRPWISLPSRKTRGGWVASAVVDSPDDPMKAASGSSGLGSGFFTGVVFGGGSWVTPNRWVSNGTPKMV